MPFKSSQKLTYGFLLAAGFGKRMGRYTGDTPKPLLRVGGIPLIVYSLYAFKKMDIENIVVNTHYMSDQIENLLGKFSMNIDISHEEEILGTAGGIKKAIIENKIPSDKNFVLLNTDLIINPLLSDELPVNLKPDIMSYLYLKERGKENNEKGWDLNHEGSLLFNENKGKFFYTGFSVLNPKILLNISENNFEELGVLWKEVSFKNQLAGGIYEKEIIFAGNLTEYEAIKNEIPAFYKEDPSFMDFAREFI